MTGDMKTFAALATGTWSYQFLFGFSNASPADITFGLFLFWLTTIPAIRKWLEKGT